MQKTVQDKDWPAFGDSVSDLLDVLYEADITVDDLRRFVKRIKEANETNKKFKISVRVHAGA